MLILRIRQAECAIADGRLDEAFALAERHDVQSHRRGQRMVARLVQALVDRAGKHLKAERLTEAAADADKARRFGGLMPEVAELRNRAAEALLTKHRAERRDARLVAAARDQIDRGDLSTGGKMLADVAPGEESLAGVLLRDVQVRRTVLTSAVTSAEAALKRDDWEAAVRQLVRVHPADAVADSGFAGVATRLGESVRQRARAALNDGDVSLAAQMLDRLSAIDGHGLDTQSLRQAVAQCRLAWDHLDRGQPRQAEEVVRRLATLLPDAKWVGCAGKQLRQASELIDELRAGPLGLCAVGGGGPPHDLTQWEAPMKTPRRELAPPPMRPASRPPVSLAADLVTGDAIPSKFLLQLDGAGTFVMLTQPVVTIGPINSSIAPDVGLMTEASASVARVERVEEDYFLRANGPVNVNGKAGASKLLNGGDELALSPRCRMTFRLPSAASTSAVLDLSGGARYPRADVRRVILLDRELVIGPGVGAHVRVDAMTENVVLVHRDGRLFVQTAQPIQFAGRDVAPKTPVPVGQHVRAGAVSFVVTHA